jgi:hypothetical protein
MRRPYPLRLGSAILELPIALRDALASLPRLMVALEDLVHPSGSAARAAKIHDPLDRLVRSGALDRLADVSTTLERLATLDQSLAKLGELGPTLARIGELSDSVRQIADLEESLLKLSAIADTMAELQESISVIAASVAPLQGTAERLGRIVDRMPSRRGRGTAVEVRSLPPGAD